MRIEVPVEGVAVSAYTIPTDFPEADGTLKWAATTLVIAEAVGGGERSLGYGYADAATAHMIKDLLAPVVIGGDALGVAASWARMVHAVRNLGRPGVASMAISVLDNALWDLKAGLVGLPLDSLMGAARQSVPV